MCCNIDVWWFVIEVGVEVIVLIVSGCGVFVKEYGDLLCFDFVYVEKVWCVSVFVCDLVEVIVVELFDVFVDVMLWCVVVYCLCML